MEQVRRGGTCAIKYLRHSPHKFSTALHHYLHPHKLLDIELIVILQVGSVLRQHVQGVAPQSLRLLHGIYALNLQQPSSPSLGHSVPYTLYLQREERFVASPRSLPRPHCSWLCKPFLQGVCDGLQPDLTPGAVRGSEHPQIHQVCQIRLTSLLSTDVLYALCIDLETSADPPGLLMSLCQGGAANGAGCPPGCR